MALLVNEVLWIIERAEYEIIPAENIFPGMGHIRGAVKVEDEIVLLHDLRVDNMFGSSGSEYGSGMTTNRLTPEILDQLSILVAEQVGLHFPRQRWQDLEKGFNTAAKELGFPDAQALADHLLSAPMAKDLLEVLASHLTINETYFFREKRIFEILEWEILPPLLASRRAGERRLRIWSAGCASGEEAYSIAILLHKVLPDLQDWQITVLATDISQRALRKAEQGIYSQWSFREVLLAGGKIFL